MDTERGGPGGRAGAPGRREGARRRTAGSWVRHLYLIYLGMLVFQPLFSPRPWLEGAVTLSLVAAFLPAYVAVFERRYRPAWPLVSWMAALGLVGVGTGLNTGASVFLVYAGAAAPVAMPRRRAVGAIALLTLVQLPLLLISPVPWPYRWLAVLPGLLFTPFIGAIQLAEADKERAAARLRMAREEAERLSAIAERERIARDLHDLLGHTLSLISLKSELAARLAEADPGRAGAEMREVQRASRAALQEVREAVRGYREGGLEGELANAKLALEASGVGFAAERDLAEPLPPVLEATLALVLREAVTNVVRHADASACRIEVRSGAGRAELRVSDDGRGLAGRAGEGAGDGGGLDGIRERLRVLGGSLELRSEGGLELVVRVPFAPGRGRSAGAPPAGRVPRAGRPLRGGA